MTESVEKNTREKVSAVGVAGHPQGKGWVVGVVGKRTWHVSRSKCELAPLQVPLVLEPLYDEQRAVLVHDADVLLNRQRTDVIVDGHIYPPNGKTPFDCGVQVGKLLRLARAFGPRRVTLDPAKGRPLFSQPQAVDKIPLSWESAYGGVDLAARADIGDPFEEPLKEAGASPDPRFGLFAYPRNPAGRGYLIEPTAAAFEACELPLIEAPESFLTPENLVRKDFVCWPEGPAVAGFGWLSYTYFPRSALMGAPPLVYDGMRIAPAGFREVTSGDLHDAAVRADRPLAERVGIGVAQSSAIGMRTDSVIPGDSVALHGLHPRELRWTFAIPNETPKMYVRLPGEKPTALPKPTIRTVFIEPDHDRLILVWTSQMQIPSAPATKDLSTIEHAVQWE